MEGAEGLSGARWRTYTWPAGTEATRIGSSLVPAGAAVIEGEDTHRRLASAGLRGVPPYGRQEVC